jgi:hypothetical protein
MVGTILLACGVLGLGLFLVVQPKGSHSTQSDPQKPVASNDSVLIVMQHVGEVSKQAVAVTTVAISPDGKLAATGLSDGSVTVWDVGRGEMTRRITGHSGAVNGVVFRPDGQLVSGGADGTLRVWDATTGKASARLEVTGGAITCVAAYPLGPYILAGSSDHTLRLWDPDRSRELRRFEGHPTSVTSVAFARDGKAILSGGEDGRVMLWTVAQTAPQATFSDQSAPVRGVAFASDTSLGVSVSDDGVCRVWDLKQRTIHHSFPVPSGDETTLTSLACSPGGTFIVAGGSDQRLHLWRIASGHVGASPPLHEQPVTGCGLSPDGLFAYSTDAEGMLHAWALPAPVDAEIKQAQAALEKLRRDGESRKRFGEHMQRGQREAQAGRADEARQEFQRAQEAVPPESLEQELAQSAVKELDSGMARKRDDYVQHMETGKKSLEAGDEVTARKEFLAAKAIAPQRPEADEGLAQIERTRQLQSILGTAKSNPKLDFDFHSAGDDLLKQGSHFAYLFDEDELAKSQRNASPLDLLVREAPQPPLGLTSSPLVWTVVVTTTKPIPEPNLKVRLRLQDAEFRRVYAEEDYILKQGTQVQNITGRAAAPEGGWTSGRYAFRYFLVTSSSERELGVPKRFSMGLLNWTSLSRRFSAPEVQQSANYTIRTAFPVIADEPYRIDATGDISPVGPSLFRLVAGHDGVRSCGPEGIFPAAGNRELGKFEVIARDLPFSALLYKLDTEPSTSWSRYQHRLSRGMSPRAGEVSLSINSVTGTRQTSRPSEKFQPVPKSNSMYWQNKGDFQVTLIRGQFEFPVMLSRPQKMHLLKPFAK